MQHKLTLILFLFLVAVGNVSAQDDPIFTDRPNVTDAIGLISKGTFQVELGYFSNKIDAGTNNLTSKTIPNYSIKYGLSDKVELRILGTYLSIDNDMETISGLSPITLSPKFALYEGLGAVPKTSLAINMTFPDLGKREFQLSEFSYGFRGLFGYVFGKISWDSSFGFDWIDGNNAVNAYSSALSYPLANRLGVFVEIYGSGRSDYLHGIDAGMTYLVTNNLQIDFIIGKNLNSLVEYTDFGFGFAWKTGN
ncbi:MAG: transporter [Fulvivirga sp.]